jgi:hypothetical protein
VLDEMKNRDTKSSAIKRWREFLTRWLPGEMGVSSLKKNKGRALKNRGNKWGCR